MTARQIAEQVVESLKGAPFVLALLVINIIVLAGFAFTLHEVGDAIERRDGLIKTCIDRSRS
jgi:hypothetical protein